MSKIVVISLNEETGSINIDTGGFDTQVAKDVQFAVNLCRHVADTLAGHLVELRVQELAAQRVEKGLKKEPLPVVEPDGDIEQVLPSELEQDDLIDEDGEVKGRPD